MNSSSVTLTYLHSIAGFPRVCSLYVYFCGAGGCPKFSPNTSCSVDHFKSQPWQWPHPLLPARGHGMLGWGQHTTLGIRETIRWLLGEINLLSAASSFTLSAAARSLGCSYLIRKYLLLKDLTARAAPTSHPDWY